MTRVAIGIDLGGTDIKAGLIAEDGTIIQKYKKSTEARLGGEKVVERIGDLIQEILDSDAMKGHEKELLGVGMGSPGLIDHNKGSITRPVNIPGWEHWICVREAFMKRFSLIKDVIVDNDANVGALGEALFGMGRGKKVVLCLTLGTGVGGGIINYGKVLHGAGGFAGELGHIMVNPSGPVCGCGNEGCLETYASANAIARYAQERLRVEHIPSIMKEMVPDRSMVTSKIVSEAALKGDKVALDVVAHAGRALGIGMSTLIVCFNPEIICIGGGASNMGDLLFDFARQEIERRVFFNSHYPTPIVQAALGEEAGTVGAAGQLF